MSKTSSQTMTGASVCSGRYRLTQRLGAGSFGEIYKGVDTQTNDIVAVKLERVKASHPQLLGESRFYSFLLLGAGGVNGCKGVKHFIPTVYDFTTEGDYNIMVMDLLGSSLENLFDYCSSRFSLKSTLMLAEQMVTALQYTHSRGIIHRDIKPDNFMMGAGAAANHVYLIDFGLAKRFRLPKTNQHIPYKDGKSLTGTARYCSINTHLGIEQSRRDDLEGVGYILVYFLQGSLPWQGLKANSKDEKYARIAQKKMATPLEVLCKGLPVEFASYINYTRALEFDECPDYGYLKALFQGLFRRLGYQRDFVYDWTLRQLQERAIAAEKQRRERTMLANSAAAAGGAAGRNGAMEAISYAVASPT